MRRLVFILSVIGLAGCEVQTTGVGQPVGQPTPAAAAAKPAASSGPRISSAQAASNFATAVRRVEPVAEAMCREKTSGVPCNFAIVIDDRPNLPPNAFQTVDNTGRPIIGFTMALIADTRNVDEIAFIIGHESSHHILGHLSRQQASAMQGELLAGVLVAIAGGSPGAMQTAQQMGGVIGSRTYSKQFELEADAMGAVITERAGFSARRGAAYFERIPDPGDRFLGSHPPNGARRQTVENVVAGLR